MNDKNIKKYCSVCTEKLQDTDDVVACTVCGAPHHRECWNKNCGCGFAELHSTEAEYTPKKALELVRRKKAGLPLDMPFDEENLEKEQSFLKENAKKDNYSAYTSNKIPAAFLGGYNEDDDIGGVTAGDVGRFVSVNPVRFVPLFAKMALLGKKTSFNFFAFLLPEAWFFFRKNYIAGLAASILIVASELMCYPANVFLSTLSLGNSYSEIYASLIASLPNMPKTALLFMIIGGLVNLMVRVVCGVFGDKIYQLNAYSKIKEFRAEASKDEHNSLIFMGGINPLAMLIGFGITSFLPQLLISLL